MDDLAGDKPGRAEHGRGLVELAFGERDSDRAGRDRPLVDIDMRLHVDLDAEPGRLVDEEARRADPTLAEVEVVADGDSADAQAPDQVVVNEVLRAGPGAGLVEGHDHGAVKSGAGQKPQLGTLVRQAELRGVGAENRRGCGSKVNASAGRPCSRPISSAAAITARWPR